MPASSFSGPGTVTVHASWRKATDQFIHARVVTIGDLQIVELRDWNESTGAYGRGIWLADSDVAREVLDCAARGPALPTSTSLVRASGRVLATLDQAPGSVIHLRVIDIDGIRALEFREYRNGVKARGYWIPFDSIAQHILTVAQTNNSIEEVA